MKIHIVQKGDTLWKIAKKYGVNFEELKNMNTQLSNPDMIMPGMKIKVPTSGSNIKKEAPLGGKPETKINMGSKKEMPKYEHPFTKEKPVPIAEAPVKEAPVKEAPIMEAPKEMPIKEAPVKEVPKEMPIMEAPKEVPMMPYKPKIPKAMIPEIDINNYYLMNMANVSVQQQPPKQMPLPPKLPPLPEMPKAPVKEMPIAQVKEMPQAPIKEMPQAKPLPKELPISQQEDSYPDEFPIQGGQYQPMFPYPPNCYPISPVMPGTGFYPGGFTQQGPMPQVQGAMTMPMQGYQPQGQMSMPMGGFQPQVQGAMGMPMNPGMQPQVQGAMTMPMGMMPGMEHDDESSSSSFMPQMPMMPSMNPMMAQPQNPGAVMGVQDNPGAGMPMGMQPTYTAPMMQGPFAPYPPNCVPISPVMPGPGFGQMPFGYPQMGGMPQVQGAMTGPMGGPMMPQVQGAMTGPMGGSMMPQVQGAMTGPMGGPMMPQVQGAMTGPMGGPMMPQVQGAMDMDESPDMGGMQPSQQQMPMMPTQAPMSAPAPMPQMQGAAEDCGCGGPGSQQMNPAMYGPGYGQGAPYMGQGGFGQMPPVYTPPFGQQMTGAQPPMMNPYGQMGTGMQRGFDDFGDFND